MNSFNGKTYGNRWTQCSAEAHNSFIYYDLSTLFSAQKDLRTIPENLCETVTENSICQSHLDDPFIECNFPCSDLECDIQREVVYFSLSSAEKRFFFFENLPNAGDSNLE